MDCAQNQEMSWLFGSRERCELYYRLDYSIDAIGGSSCSGQFDQPDEGDGETFNGGFKSTAQALNIVRQVMSSAAQQQQLTWVENPFKVGQILAILNCAVPRIEYVQTFIHICNDILDQAGQQPWWSGSAQEEVLMSAPSMSRSAAECDEAREEPVREEAPMMSPRNVSKRRRR